MLLQFNVIKMKQILIILGLFASVSTFAQSPRIKLNQITKDSLSGSVLISSPTDSGMVYSRELFISYGADTVLILNGDTLAATSGIISSVLSDGVTITGDGTTGSELTVDTTTVIATKGDLDLYYLDSNPDGYTSNTGTVTSVGGTGTVNGISLSGTVTSSGDLTLGGTLSGVDLASQVTGTLPVTNGGTGQTSFTDQTILFGNGTSSIATDPSLKYNNSAKTLTIDNVSGAATLSVLGTSSNGSYIRFNRGLGSTVLGMIDSVLYYGSGDPNNISIFRSGGSETMRLIDTKKLLIGYTSDQGAYKLQVNSQIFATNATIATSDWKYKTNIVDLNNGLDIIMNLKPKIYDFKLDPIHNFSSETQVGFIAQDVEEVISNKVFLNSIVYQNKGYLGLAYEKFIPIITKAIQEQQTIIESQANEIEQLKSQIQLILSEIEQIKNN